MNKIVLFLYSNLKNITSYEKTLPLINTMVKLQVFNLNHTFHVIVNINEELIKGTRLHIKYGANAKNTH